MSYEPNYSSGGSVACDHGWRITRAATGSHDDMLTVHHASVPCASLGESDDGDAFPALFVEAAELMEGVVRSCTVEGKSDVEHTALLEGLGRQTHRKETEVDTLHVSRMLGAAGCAALRQAVDADRSLDGDAVDRMPEHQLNMSRSQLEEYVGAGFVRSRDVAFN
eukprot:7155844-Prymnesium_polylepis.2